VTASFPYTSDGFEVSRGAGAILQAYDKWVTGGADLRPLLEAWFPALDEQAARVLDFAEKQALGSDQSATETLQQAVRIKGDFSLQLSPLSKLQAGLSAKHGSEGLGKSLDDIFKILATVQSSAAPQQADKL
jgi:hypothetical protein